MVEISKEDVLDWYKGLTASHRVEVVCALLDHSLPFELRFLGSVIENFGRKDFHILRDAENKANSLQTSSDSTQASPDVAAIIKMLSEGPAPENITINPHNPNVGGLHYTNTGGGQHSHSTTGGTTPVGGERPSPPNLIQQHHHHQHPQQQRTIDNSKNHPIVNAGVGATINIVENGLAPPPPNQSSKSTSPSSSSPRSLNSQQEGKDYVGVGERIGNNLNIENGPSSSSGVGVGSSSSNCRKDLWLQDGAKRRKLILYLSLMSATNHDSANLYYLLLSDVEDLLENLDWIQEVEDQAQDEILLLYTIGSHHPAFNFEQRTFLATVINRFRDCTTTITNTNTTTTSFPTTSTIPQHHLVNQFVANANNHFNSEALFYYNGTHPSTVVAPQPPPPPYTTAYTRKGPPPPPPPPTIHSQQQQQQSQQQQQGWLQQQQQQPQVLPLMPIMSGGTIMSGPPPAGTAIMSAGGTIMFGGRGFPQMVSQRWLPTTGGGDFPSLTAVQNALVPGLDDPVDVSCRPRKISCYNCGSNKHIGPECKELSMEEMTKMQYRLNYGGDTNNGE